VFQAKSSGDRIFFEFITPIQKEETLTKKDSDRISKKHMTGITYTSIKPCLKDMILLTIQNTVWRNTSDIDRIFRYVQKISSIFPFRNIPPEVREVTFQCGCIFSRPTKISV